MLGGGSVLSIFELHGRGKGVKEIARQLGLSRNTVRKYLRSRDVPTPKPRAPRASVLEPYKTKALNMLKEGVWNCVVVLREIRKLGYSGGITVLKEFVHQYRPLRQPEAVMRYETEPGQQAQADWGQAKYADGAKKRALYFLAYTLGYSRAMYTEFTPSSTTRALIRCLVHGFLEFGGVPETILFDRMKSVVLETDSQGKPVWNPEFLDFALAFGFVPDLCRRGRAQTLYHLEGFHRRQWFPAVRLPPIILDTGLAERLCGVCMRESRYGAYGTVRMDRGEARLPYAPGGS
jgi:transposase